MQDYRVREVVKVTPAQYGDKRVAFKTHETEENTLSVFTKNAEMYVPGSVVQGTVQEKVVDGRTFYNFVPAQVQKNDSASVVPPVFSVTNAEIKNILMLKVIPMLDRIEAILIQPRV